MIRQKILDAPGAVEYPDERIFAPAIVMVDMQLEHATKASLPSHRFPGEQGWYFNQSEEAGVTDDWFTVAALVNAGHGAERRGCRHPGPPGDPPAVRAFPAEGGRIDDHYTEALRWACRRARAVRGFRARRRCDRGHDHLCYN